MNGTLKLVATRHSETFGCTSYSQIYLGTYKDETVTEEEFVPRESEKNVNKDGTICGPNLVAPVKKQFLSIID